MESIELYHRWFGILPSELPTNAYRLLGIEVFESATDTISEAIERRRNQVRGYLNGEGAVDAQSILGELDQVETCLLSAELKAEYDAQLREQMMLKQTVTFQLGGRLPASDEEQNSAGGISLAESPELASTMQPEKAFISLPSAASAPSSRRPRSKNPLIEIAKIVGGGIVGLVLAYVLLSFIRPGNDIFRMLGIEPLFGAPADPDAK